jgi:hypothetical protein
MRDPYRSGDLPCEECEQPSPAAALTSQLCRIDIKGEKKDQWMRLPKPESSVTEHRFGVGGKSFDYTATAGTLIIRDDEDKPIASVGYVAYVRHDLKGGGARPVMFAFNGGPGSSSVWLHLGAIGPDMFYLSQDWNNGILGPVSDELMLAFAVFYFIDKEKETDFEILLTILAEAKSMPHGSSSRYAFAICDRSPFLNQTRVTAARPKLREQVVEAFLRSVEQQPLLIG